MANNSSGGTSGGISFLGALGVAFIVLKLTKVIAWSWWLVLLPIYGGLVLVLLALLVFVLIGAAASFLLRKK